MRTGTDGGQSVVEWIHQKYAGLADSLAERNRRTWAAVEARALGWGGAKVVPERGRSLERAFQGRQHLRLGIAVDKLSAADVPALTN
jgi:hypothetical protein